MNMNNEIERHEKVKELVFRDIPSLEGTSNLLAFHNASLPDSKNKLSHFKVNTSLTNFKTESHACFSSIAVAILGGTGGMLMDVSGNIIFPTAIGSIVVVIPAYIYGSKILNHMYLRYCMRSKNPKKRSYYVNKVLDFMLVDSIDSELFDVPAVLGYSLWFHEKTRIIRSQNNDKSYRKIFSTTSSEDFRNDKLFLLYMNVAEDMISGTLDRECIPRIPQTTSHKRLYEKYPEIIDSRPKDRVTY